jgi:hypothetical protein
MAIFMSVTLSSKWSDVNETIYNRDAVAVTVRRMRIENLRYFTIMLAQLMGNHGESWGKLCDLYLSMTHSL